MATESAPEGAPVNLDWPAVKRLLLSLEVPREQAVALVSDLYEREIPAQLAALTAAALAEDRLQTMQLAHKLRGGSWQLGALGLAAACATLEAAAKNPDRPALAGQADQIRQIYDETWALLQERLRTLA